MTPGDRNVKTAFESIGNAATMLEIAEKMMGCGFREAVELLHRQENLAWFTDPTRMNAPGTYQDLRRKLRLLTAAADFLAVHRAVQPEVAAEQPETAEVKS